MLFSHSYGKKTSKNNNMMPFNISSSTFDYRVRKTGLPVHSAVLKPYTKRSQFSKSPGFVNSVGSCFRVSMGDIGENPVT